MADVTIRGAGIFGLSIAWTCVQRGARVRVVDPFGPGAGSSGGLVGALAPHVPENWNSKKAFQLDSLIAAEAFWHGVKTAAQIDPGYARTGRLQPIVDDQALNLARKRTVGAKVLWHDLAHWEVIPTHQTEDWAPHSPTGFLIHDTLSARLHPRQACRALIAALARHGVSVATDAPDQGAVIWATGLAGLDALSKDRSRPVGNGVKGQAALLALATPLAPDAPQLFADAVHIVPHADGTVAVGSTSEREYAEAATTDGQLDEVIARAKQSVPALRNARVIDRWAGVRPRSRSRAPMLGPWPGRTGQFIANGGFKIGFGMAPGIASAMAKLVLDGTDTIPDDFRVEASF